METLPRIQCTDEWVPLVDTVAPESGNAAYVLTDTDIVCVDVDLKKPEALGSLISISKKLPPTYGEQSRSGKGLHLFYRGNVYKNRVNWMPGIDVLTNGFIFMNPEFVRNNLAIAQLPEFLVLEKPVEYTKNKVEEVGLVSCGHYCYTQISVGARNDTIFRYGMALAFAGASNWAQHVTHSCDNSGLSRYECALIKQSIERKVNI